jgi:hypothetical protein
MNNNNGLWVNFRTRLERIYKRFIQRRICSKEDKSTLVSESYQYHQDKSINPIWDFGFQVLSEFAEHIYMEKRNKEDIDLLCQLNDNYDVHELLRKEVREVNAIYHLRVKAISLYV